MKRKFKNKLLIILTVLASLFIFGGCTLGETFEEILSTRDLNPYVTYYANGGIFEDKKSEKNIYYKIGSGVLNIAETSNTTSGTVKVNRDGYTLLGWYFVELDEEGKPIFEDEEKGLYKLGEPVDFKKTLVKDEHWIIAADWQPMTKVNVVLAVEEGKTLPVATEDGEKMFKNGDVIGSIEYDTTGNAYDVGEIVEVKDKAFTFIKYYADAACTQTVSWPLKPLDTDDTVYAKYIEGDWTLVSSAKDVRTMFSKTGAKERYWILNDIDCKGSAITSATTFAAEVQGNGFTISNFKVIKGEISSGAVVALFGNITATAKLENVTFANVSMEYTVKSGPLNIYFAYASLDDAATVTNVSLQGKMTIKKSDKIRVLNMMDISASYDDDGDGNYDRFDYTYRYDNALFGGVEKDEEANAGFKVEGKAEEIVVFTK
ncbi:MAG: hypothetical protein E7366_05260 [Clostridiales bacterium]|nr:hypothetical protein [Clostridiales bacterium]